MAGTLRPLCRRRRWSVCCIRIAVAGVFALWFLSIFYGAYYSQQPGTDHDEADQSRDGYSDDQRREEVVHPEKGGEDGDAKADQAVKGILSEGDPDPADVDPSPGLVDDVQVLKQEEGEEEGQLDASHPKFFFSKGPVNVGRGPKEYVEYDWKGHSLPGHSRTVIVPGDRRDPPRMGEFGRAVTINPSSLDRQERVQYHEGWDKFKFNDFASQKISLQRDVPDFRHPECAKQYGEFTTFQRLPRASIIICFYNEAWSVLLRSIYSILLRSPPHLVGEIILVDDHSDLDELKEPLEKFVRDTAKLRLLRMRHRSGLVRARLAGVDAAIGPTLIFLDSHIECGDGWLQPLLSALAANPSVAVTPQIDVISDRTFAINNANPNIGVLEFKSFNFDWGSILPRIRKNIQSPADGFQSPTMAGGLFAIRKDFFLYLGTYDPHLALWGGENIELSLKMWLCGDGILTHPCSRVAHVFRDTSPYLTGTLAHVAVINSARVAYVWTDEYRKVYFHSKTFSDEEWKNIKNNIQERIDLRKSLGCKSFRWFLEHVYPELHIDGTGQFTGPIMSSSRHCIHLDQHEIKDALSLRDCKEGASWEYSRVKEVRTQQQCLTALDDELLLADCDFQGTTQVFEYNIQTHALYHPYTNRCLTTDGTSVYLGPCLKVASDQVWYWRLNKDYIP